MSQPDRRDIREDRREGIERAGARLVEQGIYKTHTEATARVAKAVRRGQLSEE